MVNSINRLRRKCQLKINQNVDTRTWIFSIPNLFCADPRVQEGPFYTHANLIGLKKDVTHQSTMLYMCIHAKMCNRGIWRDSGSAMRSDDALY